MNMPVVIRSAQLNDLTAIRTVEQRAHTHPWSESTMINYLKKPNAVWLLTQQEKVLGYLVVSRVLEESELLMISIDPAVQGQGYGKQLLTFAQQVLIQQGAERMFLEVRESNEKAIALYDSLGFCEIARRENYYPAIQPAKNQANKSQKGHTREDALVMSMELLSD